ncbi:MAG: ImmA/IrrE family metallo-endopeptidase [Clostridia bacterium]|nr:ImmA/IrrE family metallo-endopeptidase [Clostridia bacterium]
MYKPYLKKKSNGLPILSKEEINSMCERFISEFQPDALVNPQPIDIEMFAEGYLNITVDYFYLSHNLCIYGATVFNDTNKMIIYDPEKNEADYIHVSAMTIILDCRLVTDARYEHLGRMTMGHECGHAIMHTSLYYRNPDQLSMFDVAGNSPIIKCRINESPLNSKFFKTDEEWVEWQANYFASALLMPKTPLLKLARELKSELSHTRLSQLQIEDILSQSVSDTFNVSKAAAVSRLKNLMCI